MVVTQLANASEQGALCTGDEVRIVVKSSEGVANLQLEIKTNTPHSVEAKLDNFTTF